MKKLVIIIYSAAVVLFVGFMLWYRWGYGTNHEFEFGYYGEFNRVSNALASIPGVTVTQSWHNRDVTLEEFGFTATKSNGEPVRISIGERDRIAVCPATRWFRRSGQRFRHRHRPDDCSVDQRGTASDSGRPRSLTSVGSFLAAAAGEIPSLAA